MKRNKTLKLINSWGNENIICSNICFDPCTSCMYNMIMSTFHMRDDNGKRIRVFERMIRNARVNERRHCNSTKKKAKKNNAHNIRSNDERMPDNWVCV